MSQLGDKLRALATEADALAGELPQHPPGPDATRAEPYAPFVLPHVVEVQGGVRYLMRAPVNPLFQPSLWAWTLAHDPSHFIQEPSNAPDGMPLRSPNGFPLMYPFGADKTTPTGPASVVQGDSTYESDEALFKALDAAKQRDANLAGWKH